MSGIDSCIQFPEMSKAVRWLVKVFFHGWSLIILPKRQVQTGWTCAKGFYKSGPKTQWMKWSPMGRSFCWTADWVCVSLPMFLDRVTQDPSVRASRTPSPPDSSEGTEQIGLSDFVFRTKGSESGRLFSRTLILHCVGALQVCSHSLSSSAGKHLRLKL